MQSNVIRKLHYIHFNRYPTIYLLLLMFYLKEKKSVQLFKGFLFKPLISEIYTYY